MPLDSRFTHHDPFEDTERGREPLAGCHSEFGFTHHDPFEDTESKLHHPYPGVGAVSPITIRSRILKGDEATISIPEEWALFHPSRSVRGY